MEDFKSKIDGAKRLDKKINNVKGIYIVPNKKIHHDSGYECMTYYAVTDDNEYYYIDGWSDSMHLENRLGNIPYINFDKVPGIDGVRMFVTGNYRFSVYPQSTSDCFIALVKEDVDD